MTQQKPYRIAVVGAGKIGQMISRLLAGSGDYAITLIDQDAAAFAGVEQFSAVTPRQVDVEDPGQLEAVLADHVAVLNATPFFLTERIAQAARSTGLHYLDLTEDVARTAKLRELAEGAEAAFIPQCGLAPGFISIVTHDIASQFDTLDTVRMCVGALPQFPSNSLNYNLTWSTDGVINEYCEPCVAIQSGELVSVPALEPDRHPDSNPYVALEPVPAGDYTGSVMTVWDDGPVGGGARDGGTAPPPITNTGPFEPEFGEDPHELPRREPAAQLQKSEFLKPEGEGRFVDTCDPSLPCTTDGYVPGA